MELGWEEVERAVLQIAEKIHSSGFRPDIIIGISRGGLVPARLLSDSLGNHELYTIRIGFYTGIGKTAKEPKILQDISLDVYGKKILLVDDISDTGASFSTAVSHLEKRGALEIRAASLHFKPSSSFRPDFFAATTNEWIVYPWEKHEFKTEKEGKVRE
ncbi:MAG: phosphoribosyltransferase [Candidatus Bilamarchaeaceae archaeon]